MAQEAAGDAGDAGHANDASVDTASRGNRKHRPGHRGRIPTVAELIERRSGARPDPPWRGAWLQRTNLWRNRTKPRTASERLRGVANDRAGLIGSTTRLTSRNRVGSAEQIFGAE